MDDDFEPGYEWCCEGCRHRVVEVDENGTSYECFGAEGCMEDPYPLPDPDRRMRTRLLSAASSFVMWIAHAMRSRH